MLLALDTSTPLGSVAVGGAGGEVLARRLLRRQGAHASALLPAVHEALEEAAATPEEIEGVVVGAGPGSFTGVRVAAATAKGLVRALGVPLRAVSSLAAGAVAAGLDHPELGPAPLAGEEGERPRVVLFDARGERVYAACYRVAGGRLEVLETPRPDRIGDVLDRAGPFASPVFCGRGALRHRERIESRGHPVLPAPAGVPTADALLAVVGLEPGVRPVDDPGRWEPEYVREWRPG